MKRPIENNSSPGQAVYEPFCGSGTSIIAAEITGRICYAIELDPAYVDVAVERWQKFTGETAKLEGDGLTFAEVATERGVDPRDSGHGAGAAEIERVGADPDAFTLSLDEGLVPGPAGNGR